MFLNYFIPWSVIAILISGVLSWSYFSHGSISVDVETLAFSCGGTAYIIALWVAHVAQKQAIVDMKASLLLFEKDETLDEGSMYFLIHAWSGCIVIAIFIITRFMSLVSFTPMEVTLIDAFIAAISAMVGALSGLLRARAQELKHLET